MNIFATHECPRECAVALDDKRVGKMLMEANQMLSLAVKMNLPLIEEEWEGSGRLVRGWAYLNHPVSQWVRSTRENFTWTISHAADLALEYRHRFRKKHASEDRTVYLWKFRELIPEGHLTPFQNSARNGDVDFSWMEDPTLAYREYLNARWTLDKRAVKWTRREPPVWANLGACSGGPAVQV